MNNFLIINNAEPGITEFSEPIKLIIKNAGFETFETEYKDCIKYNSEKIDGIILTGSPQGDDIVEHHLPYFKWIINCNVPILGICAGHHIIGFLYGGKLLRNEEPESGDFDVTILKEDPIFNKITNIFKVKQMHNDSITLPDEFELLAPSYSCKNQIMKHKGKPIYTCQFHPEYYNHDLILNFITICNKKTA